MTEIIIDPKKLKELYPYFKDVSDEVINNASEGIGTFISTKLGEINITDKMQIRGNYLACCHIIFLQLNPAIAQGIVSNASQGSESLSYQKKPIKNWLDYQLGLTIYGLELLVILKNVQPPISNKPTNPYPYYNILHVNNEFKN